MNNAVLIMFVYVLLYICVCTSFDGYIARSGSAGSYDMPVFNFGSFQISFVNLYSCQQCKSSVVLLS